MAEEDESETQPKRVQMDEVDDSGRISEQQGQQQQDRRSVNSSRMPTARMTRPRLIRTPANKDDATVESQLVPDDETKEPHTPDILITEVKDQPELVEGDIDDGEESDVEPEYKQVTVETVDAEDDWDTDLEIEGKKKIYKVLL